MLALSENLDREDLSPLEEAWAFAREITVDRATTDLFDVDINYTEYVREYHLATDRVSSTYIPSESNPVVEDLAENTKYGKSAIRYRLEYLVFPEEAREMIDSGELSKRAARIIVRVARQIDDPRAARRRLGSLADEGAKPLRGPSSHRQMHGASRAR